MYAEVLNIGITNHEHTHNHCSHLNMAYCSSCNVAYCEDCKREWGSRNWQYRYTPYWSGLTYTAQEPDGTIVINNASPVHNHS